MKRNDPPVGRRAACKLHLLSLVLISLLTVACRPGTGADPAAAPSVAVASTPVASATAVQTLAPTASPTPVPATPVALPPTPTRLLPTPTTSPVSTVETLPESGSYTWVPVVGGLSRPLALTHAADGSGRLFVVEQAGLIRVISDGELQTTPFLDIRDRVGSSANEQGLLGLAFHPQYAENGLFYVNYTDRRGDTVIARFRGGEGTDAADPASETMLLQVAQPYGNHNGGGLAFGPDGYLYIALGDGGSAGDPQGNGQSLQTMLGKLLRIDVDQGNPYAIPADNPFAGGQGLPEIWAYGLRNPWRFTFDRLTGDLYVADVGQNVWEEVNFLAGGSPGGANFGWDFREGRHPFEGQPPADLGLVEPVAEYDHSQGCSVTGGVVYRGESLPAWQGVYMFGDYCSGLVWGLLPGPQPGGWQNAQLFSTGARIASFGVDEVGEVFLVDHNGSVYQLVQQ